MLAFTQKDVNDIAKLLKIARRDVSRRFEHFQGLHELGEASEKQQDLMFFYGDLLMLIESVINEAKE